MRQVARSFATRSIFLIALSLLLVQGPGGLASPAVGSCVDARFAPQLVVPTGASAEGIAVADFNGDGNLDLAVTNFTAGGGNSDGVAVLDHGRRDRLL